MKVDRRHDNPGRPGGGVTKLHDRTRYLTKGELHSFLRAAQAQGPKHHLIFALIYWFAMRAGECSGLRLADFRPVDRGNAHRYTALTIQGLKGGRTIEPEVPALIIDLLKAWLKRRSALPNAESNEWLFPARRQARTEHMSTEAIKVMFRTISKAAGIEGKHSVHDLRHSRAQHMAEDGKKQIEIASWLRHRNVSSSDRYIHGIEVQALSRSMAKDAEELLK